MNEKFRASIATKIPWLRKLVLLFLKKTSKDITIKNPYTNKNFRINTFNHKGYWYYGKTREEKTTKAIYSLIKKGDIILEIGGHLGFISHLYSDLIGETGFLYIFEPGENNIPYIRDNIKSLKNVELIEKGCADKSGSFDFYEDQFTGQNNSLFNDYEGLITNSKFQILEAKQLKRIIEVITLDEFIKSRNINIQHIKIDVEGAELLVIKGLKKYLGKIPSFMIEISRNQNEIYELMASKGYIAFDEDMNRIKPNVIKTFNVFFILEKFI